MRTRALFALAVAGILLAGCTSAAAPSARPTPPAGPAEHAIVVDAGGFVDTRTGEPFQVRGVNYFVIVPADGGYQDRFFSPGVFDPSRIRDDFRALAEVGYTTVRLFLDTCSIGPDCIAGRDGLNPAFLESIAETMRIAQETGLFLILTSNDLPDGGGYAERAHRSDPDVFAGYRNSVFLTRAGATAAEVYWDDLLSGLAEIGAPFGSVLSWSIVNEMWVFPDQPPLSLRVGVVRGADGSDYDMADDADRRELVLAGFAHYLDSVAAVIRRHDPHGLVTAGFFAPKFPHPTDTGGGWYVDTAPLIGEVDLDFFDFHGYPGGDLTATQLAENFGVPAADLPVVMGEVGAFVERYDTAASAALALQQWSAESCAAGFDGWLHWGYLRAPVAVGDAAWGLADDDGYLLDALSPREWPDPCVRTIEDPDLARAGTASASAHLSDQPPSAAIDGSPGTNWGSGGDAPQWLEVQLAAPATVARVRLEVAQFPAGRTVHEVAVRTAAEGWRTVAVADGHTEERDVLDLAFAPVADVVAVRVTTTVSPSWVSWWGVEILAE